MDRKENTSGFDEALPTIDEYLEFNLRRLREDQRRVESRIAVSIEAGEAIRGESGMEVSPEEARGDLADAKKYREKLKRQWDSVYFPTLAEIIVYRLIEEYGMLGADVRVIKTIDVDDFGAEDQRNRKEGGVDLVVEVEVDGQISRMAIDVTTADPGASVMPIETARVLDDKISKVKRYAGAGRDSARVKYCGSKIDSSFVGPVYAPKAIVVLPREVVKDLVDLDSRAQLRNDEEAAVEVKNHPAVAELAFQIDIALKLAQERAQRLSRGSSNIPVADKQVADIIIRRTSVFRDLARKTMLNGPNEVADKGAIRMIAISEQLEAMYEDRLPESLKRAIRTRN